MIQAINKELSYQAQFSSKRYCAQADAAQGENGGKLGFRPHELLEAALAVCMNLTAMTYAKNHGVPLVEIITRVSLDWSGSEQVVFHNEIELKGEITVEQRQAVIAAAHSCHVRKLLSRGVRFSDDEPGTAGKKI